MLGQPKEIRISVPGIPGAGAHTITCYEWGDPAAQHIVLCVHGLTRNGRDFDYLADALGKQGFRVICPDMPGRGKSDWLAGPAGYNYGAYVADIIALLAQLKIDTLDWVGTSMGGIIAMAFAGAQPGRIRSLVLNDIGSVVSAAGLKRIYSYAGVTMDFATRAEAEMAMRNIWAPFGITKEEHWQHLFTYGIRALENGRFGFSYDPAIMAGLQKPEGEVQDMDLWAMFEAVKPIPTLLIRGVNSDLLSHETALAMQAQHADLMIYEVPGAGHAPALMEERDINAVCEFLKNKNA